jgi:hypothetical protein
MNISQILRGLLDVIEKNQAEDDEIEQTNLEMLPVVDTQELSISDAEQEFSDEQGVTDDSCDSDFAELDVVKRNAGLPVMVISTDGAGF